MKKNIHPESHELKLIFPDGGEFVTTSSLNMGRYILDIFYKNHPAWTGKASLQVNSKDKKVAGFNKKFGGLSSLFGSVSDDNSLTSEEEKKD